MTEIRQLLPNSAELTAIGRRYSQSSPSTGKQEQRSPGDSWVGIVNDPFRTVEETRTRLTDLEAQFRADGDRRAVFLTVYTEMTKTVEAGIESGYFDNPEWVRRSLVTFANYYRRAVVGYETGESEAVPTPWQVGFDAILGGSTFILQDALLGINAHINYDLTYTVEEIGIDPKRQEKFRDYSRINDILAGLVDTVQESLVAVYSSQNVATLDPLFGSLDEYLTLEGLKLGREFAWENAEFLTDYDWPVIRSYVDWYVTSVSTGVALLILSPELDPTVGARIERAERRQSPIEDFRTAFQNRSSTGDIASRSPHVW